jgi:hypothetical protein
MFLLSEKILPFTCDIPIKALTIFSHPFGILKANDFDVVYLLLNYFIVIHFNRSRGFLGYTFGEKKVKELFDRNTFPVEAENIKNFIKRSLDENQYVQLSLNHETISSFPVTHKFIHGMIIYGYDDKKDAFLASDYVNENGISELRDNIYIKYDELILSYASDKKDSIDFVTTVNIKEGTETELIDIHRIKRDLFLYAYNILPYTYNLAFNKRAHKEYIRHFIKKCTSNDFYIDVPFIKILQEHSYVLKLLADEFSTGELQQLSEELHDIFSRAIMLGVKCNMQHNKSNEQKIAVIGRIVDLLKLARVKEFELVKRLYKKL